LVGVSAVGPGAVGVTVNVRAAALLLNMRVIGALNPPPLGVMVMVPV
jgi:hypothetical protein